MFAQSCQTLCDPIDCSAPGSFPLGVVQARILESFLFPTQRIFPDPGIKPASPALAGRFFTTVPPIPSMGPSMEMRWALQKPCIFPSSVLKAIQSRKQDISTFKFVAKQASFVKICLPLVCFRKISSDS